MDKGFEQIARKARAPYLANPARYHPTERRRSPATAIALIVSIAAGYSIAHFTEPFAFESFRGIFYPVKAKSMPTFYSWALVAYYAAALFAMYVLMRAYDVLEKRAGGEGDDAIHLPYFAASWATIVAPPVILAFTLFVVLVPMDAKGKVETIKLLALAALGMWLYMVVIIGIYEIYRRLQK